MSSNHKPDIIWILIDGIRPDKLRSCGNLNRPYLFIDKILLKGTLFTKVISAGANTKTSMHAAFTSLYPSINKMNAYNPMLQTKLDSLAITLTDILRYSAYKTFRYVDVVDWKGIVDTAQVVPTSGFDVWESGGYRILRHTPEHSFSTNKRDAFITNFNQSPGPKFTYIHLATSHEINIESKAWTSALYEKNLFEVDKDFEDVWNKLQITNSTLVIISTDHGARLDIKDAHQEEQQYGMKLRDISMNAFCSFIGPGIQKQVINRMIRTIDIVPTILEIAGCDPLLGQGKDLVPLIRGEEFPEVYAFMETGGIYQKPPVVDESDIWGVRTEKWKYWCHAWKGEWLIDLENDSGEEINLIGNGLPVEDRLRKLVRKYRNDTRTPEQIYAENAQTKGISKYFTKWQIVPEVSLFLFVQEGNFHLADVINSILAQISVYFELIVVDTTPGGNAKNVVQKYRDYKLSYKHYRSNTLISIFNDARGKYVTCVSSKMIYKPYFLYELKNILREKPEIALVYSSYQEIDQIGLKKVISAHKNIFDKKNDFGYCFLARKGVVSKVTNSKVTIFNNNKLHFHLEKNSLTYHFPRILGNKHHKAAIWTICLHILHKVIDVKRKEGWQAVRWEAMNFLRRFFGKIKFKKLTNLSLEE